MSGEAERLFEEYVQAEHESRRPDRDELLARAGPDRDELAQLLHLFDTLEAVRVQIGASLTKVTDGEGLSTPDDSFTGLPLPPDFDSLGRFRGLSLIGRGGLSCVYLATDPDLARQVALKVLLAPHLDAARAAAWMLNEGRSLARLKHDGIVRVYEVGAADGQAFIAMEHLQGPSLRDVLKHLRRQAGHPDRPPPPPNAAPPDLPPGTAPAEPPRRSKRAPRADPAVVQACAEALAPIAARCELIACLADALDDCHVHGVIHRDVKPSNILLVDGRPRLIDFGLAHLESPEGTLSEITQSLVGTPAYIAPEQVHNNRTGASERSDQFSLGIVLFELLTLVNPFQRTTKEQTLAAIAATDRPRLGALEPGLPADLERIVDHCLERDPADRYARLADLAADLRASNEQRVISLNAGTPVWIARRRRGLGIAATVLGMVLLVALGAAVIEQHHARRDLDRRLATLDAGLPGLDQPDDFGATLRELQSLADQARSLDAAWMTHLVADPAGPGVTQVLHDASDALAARLARALAVPPGTSDAAREILRRERLATWSQPLALESILCPECTANLPYRQ